MHIALNGGRDYYFIGEVLGYAYGFDGYNLGGSTVSCGSSTVPEVAYSWVTTSNSHAVAFISIQCRRPNYNASLPKSISGHSNTSDSTLVHVRPQLI